MLCGNRTSPDASHGAAAPDSPTRERDVQGDDDRENSGHRFLWVVQGDRENSGHRTGS